MAAETDRENFGEILQNELDENVQGVRVQDIVEDVSRLGWFTTRAILKPTPKGTLRCRT